MLFELKWQEQLILPNKNIIMEIIHSSMYIVFLIKYVAYHVAVLYAAILDTCVNN